MSELLLSASHLAVNIQLMPALRDLNVQIREGEMVGLMGRNGAGKTTFMRTVMGHLPPTSGRIEFRGESLDQHARHERAALGIGYMPEDRGLVPQLTVEENILLPIWVSKTLNREDRLAFVYGLMPEVADMRARRALQLSGGQQKLVALCRALAVGTRLLLLDEPFEGVAPALSMRLADVIHQLKGSKLAVLISQSDVNHSGNLFDHSFVIERGANSVVEAQEVA
ncbi:ABC transporter related [Rhodoferax ferrireducens T118]|uniref:ABC transporter related n=1 Tax=Albidiferax ferrireducens (strain ATCC BAA-621 / DSM 15236 / T118) TaxID=338969 RepID=Q21ZP4_ALBFT|nr:ATP-binding cassette domain-containing protein [Rhodoferax ferrireducens]ABD68759.1 ABC transporter related [Rhodoferax ferrireducens T118]WPC67986.1 ATP-binding cassette domain-containing protein [Rhodoferax ferrireducens]